MTKRDLLSIAKIIVETPAEKSMCPSCGEVSQDSYPHICDPEERASAGMSATMKMILTGKGPKARAVGYSVQG